MPLLEFHKKHNIATAAYAGLASLTRHKGGPVDPVLPPICRRLEKDTGKPVTEVQVLGLWMRAHGVVQITSVLFDISQVCAVANAMVSVQVPRKRG